MGRQIGVRGKARVRVGRSCDHARMVPYLRPRSAAMAVAGAVALASCHAPPVAGPIAPNAPSAPAASTRGLAPLPGESHLGDLRQLTFGGENAEAYWSPNGAELIFQAHAGEG